jgi:hypothetical protein
MRPLGHDGARSERDAFARPIESALIIAWERFAPALNLYVSHLSDFEDALDLLDDVRPSQSSIDNLILRTPPTERLSVFATACYQLLPDNEVHYTLNTPDLHSFGSYLCGKHLIVDGTLGDLVGEWMIGTLTINGTCGARPGHYMIGILHAASPAVSASTITGAVGRPGKPLHWLTSCDQERFLIDITNPRNESVRRLDMHLRDTYSGGFL